jgi:hypothetical protein
LIGDEDKWGERKLPEWGHEMPDKARKRNGSVRNNAVAIKMLLFSKNFHIVILTKKELFPKA